MYAVVLQLLRYKSRKHIGHQPEMDRPVFIIKRDTGQLRGKHARNMNILLCQQAAAKGKPLSGIVVPRNNQYCRPQLRQSRYDAVQQGNRLPRGRTPVVNIPRNDDRVWLYLPHQLQKTFCPDWLVAVFQQGNSVNGFPEM